MSESDLCAVDAGILPASGELVASRSGAVGSEGDQVAVSDEPNQMITTGSIMRAAIWSPTMDFRWRAPHPAALAVQPYAKVLEQKYVDVSLFGGATEWRAVPTVYEP
jgi:hypothetical protein